MSSMENIWRWMLITAIAPIAWGSTYVVTSTWLPADAPLWGAVWRALPAGVLLLLFVRVLPRGVWWWRSLVLGVLNIGAFFVLIYVAAQLLPSSIASMIMAMAPIAMMLVAWGVIREKPQLFSLIGAGLGFAGVVALLATGSGTVNTGGVIASLAAMLMSSVGFIFTKRWSGSAPLLPMTAWQLTAGGLAIVPVAFLVEGAPAPVTASEFGAFAYLSLVATLAAFVGWNMGLRKLPAGAVGLIGLLNPVTGVLLGVAVAGETLTALQFGGIALVFVGILIGQAPVRAAVAGAARRVLPGRRRVHRGADVLDQPRVPARDEAPALQDAA